MEPGAVIIIRYWWLLSDGEGEAGWVGKVRGGHIPDPRAAAGWSSVSTYTKRQVTLAALL